MHSARSAGLSRADKRLSRQLNGAELNYPAALQFATTKSTSRPSSPMVEQENRAVRIQRYPAQSPAESAKREQNPSYFGNGSGSTQQAGRYAVQARANATPTETPQTARFAHHINSSPSGDNLVAHSGVLPTDKALIRAIYDNGRSSVVNVEGCKAAEDIVIKTLKKGLLNEAHYKSYCFYVLDGVEPDPTFCRRIGDAELVRLCNDRNRNERGRLILRKIHAGEPEGEQLRVAAKIAEKQRPSPPAIEVQQPNKTRSQLKIEKLTGEPLPAVSYPMSPAALAERERANYFTSPAVERGREAVVGTGQRHRTPLKEWHGTRPPTELITADLTSYFPDVEKEEMDKTLRMSMRRSRRLSRAAMRLSTVSNFSIASSLKDAPPLPTIADVWRQNNGQLGNLRPLSVVHLGRSLSVRDHRDSVASSVLEPLEEESSEPNRKSYVSFGAESGSDSNTGNLAVTDPNGNTVVQSYFDDTHSSPTATENGGSLNARLSQAIAEDSEEDDEELMEHLEKDSWDNIKYMKGNMIGQGSFGTVFLALHAITGELMAVKQVEMPSASGTSLDAKKNNMVEALKHEIGLLRELKHPNIVQYLGSNSDECHLNIFLEYVAGGSVATMLVNYGPLREPLVANFVRQILNGLAYLHSKDIIHRDIKGANILVDNHGGVKISDFGISKRVQAGSLLSSSSSSSSSASSAGRRQGPRVSLQGSVFWMAPEVVKQTAYTRKADIWSLGCLVVEMFTGHHPHPSLTQLQAIFKIGGSSSPSSASSSSTAAAASAAAGGGGGGAGAAADPRPAVPEGVSPAARRFLERAFEVDFERRPAAEELMREEFCVVRV
ncbi:hypothetical protein LTR28_008079 [Elasticomyces elasticus]|nr:hypothetical protein LTR28_008079 [Elasticomyces elasticus]